MANAEATEAARTSSTAIATADVLIAIPSPTQAGLLQQRVREVAEGLSRGPVKFALAYPGTEGAVAFSVGATAEDIDDKTAQWVGEQGSSDDVPANGASSRRDLLHVVEYVVPPSPAAVPWLGLSAAYAQIANLARQMGAKTCAIISADLAAFDVASIHALIEPVHDGRAALSMPLYAPSKFEGLLNSGILYPFTRALYGRRVRYPLGPDFSASTELLGKMGRRKARSGETEDDQAVIWPGIVAALSDASVAQVHLDGRHGAQNEGLDLSTVLGHLAGSLFSDAEKHPVVWQRIRGSQPGLVLGSAGVSAASDHVDVRPMIESFHLASRNLQEVWALILPPVTLLEIKRLGRMTPEQFRIADPLWARIIYDFALAYRLRSLNRTHLLGALTPLYLGWVASYAQEIADMDTTGAEQRVEKLAKAYEDEKAYLVSRWRWPDRFNP